MISKTAKRNYIEEKVMDIISKDMFVKTMCKNKPKSTTVDYLVLKTLVNSYEKINPVEITIVIDDDSPLLLKPKKSDSGIVIANIKD